MVLPVRTRLALAYTMVLLGGLAVSAAIVLWQQERIGLRRVDRELTGLNATLANVLRDELTEQPNPRTAAEVAQNLVTVTGRAVAVLDTNGHVIAARWNGLELPKDAATASAGITTLDTPHGAWRVHIRPQTFGAMSFTLVVASPLTDVHRERHEAREAMMIGI